MDGRVGWARLVTPLILLTVRATFTLKITHFLTNFVGTTQLLVQNGFSYTSVCVAFYLHVNGHFKITNSAPKLEPEICFC